MDDDFCFLFPSNLSEEDNIKSLEHSVFYLNLYVGGVGQGLKPYRIDYTILLMSFHLWKGNDLDEFCHKQTISHFLFNPDQDSTEARKAYFLEIREFLSGK